MLSAVLMQGSPVARPVRRMERRNRSWMYRLVWGKPRPGGQRYRERLPQLFASVPVVQVDGDAPPADELRALDLDFILVFGNDALGRSLIPFARHGVWAYSFGSWPRIRSNLVAFWEVYRREPVTSAVLLRLTPDPDSATILREAHLRTKPTFNSNREHILARIAHLPALVAIGLQLGDTTALDAPPVKSSAPVRQFPANLQMLTCPLRSFWFVARVSAGKFLRRDLWNIGVCEQPVSAFLDSRRPRARVRWLPQRSRSQFLADPFGVMHKGRLLLLCEHLDYGVGRGAITASTEPDLGELAQIKIGPDKRIHLSYPCLFEHDGRIYCVPETHQAREVALYVMGETPSDWQRVGPLLTDCEISDPTVFQHEGRWWIAGADPGLNAPSADLYLWYSDSLAGPWTAHPANLVKTDVRASRPAGRPFVVDGVLYRPAQDGSRSYGGSVTINRVVELTPTRFREELATIVEPDRASPFPDGLHTLCGVGDITLIDSKRSVFALFELWYAIVRRIRGGMSPV